MSDHLPMWVELDVDFADAFLEGRARIERRKRRNGRAGG